MSVVALDAELAARADTLVGRLIRSVRAIRDHRLHGAAVERFFAGASPPEAAHGLRLLMTHIDRPGYRMAYHAVVHFFVHRDGSDYAGLQAIYTAARRQELHPVLMLLLRVPALLAANPEDVLPDPELLDVPLGRRKSMARGRDRDLLTRLAMDPSPPVVELLLQNPLLLERDVVRLAARRPNMADVLRLTAAHPRWSQRYEVQKALLLNPYTPCSIASSLVPFMRGRDLKETAQNLRLHEGVRNSARQVDAWRSERRQGVA